MYHFHNFGQSLRFRGGADSVERGAEIGGEGLIAFRGRVRTNTTEVSVFLATKKIGVRQYEDSDSKPGVGVSTQARVPVDGHQRGLQL